MKKSKLKIFIFVILITSCFFSFFNERTFSFLSKVYERVYVEIIKKSGRIEKIIEKDCNVNLENSSKEKIAIELMDFVFRTTKRGKQHEEVHPIRKVLMAHSAIPVVQICGGYSTEFACLLEKVNIDVHLIFLAVRDYFSKKGTFDTHVLTEVNLNNKWIVMDPTFNCWYSCSNGMDKLSLEEMNFCVKAGYDLIPREGKTKIKGYSLGEYYIPLKDLMFAYKIVSNKLKIQQDWMFFE